MRRFELIDGSRRVSKACAVVSWDEGNRTLAIEVCEWAGEADLPMTLGALVAKGQRRIEGEWARRWVSERVTPSGRQNLGAVLKANGLDFYDEFDLFLAAYGRCAQDDFYLRELEEQGDETPAKASEKIAAELRSARKEAGLTQHELAQRAGLKQTAVSRLESGKSNPTVDMLEAISRALGKTLELKLR